MLDKPNVFRTAFNDMMWQFMCYLNTPNRSKKIPTFCTSCGTRKCGQCSILFYIFSNLMFKYCNLYAVLRMEQCP